MCRFKSRCDETESHFFVYGIYCSGCVEKISFSCYRLLWVSYVEQRLFNVLPLPRILLIKNSHHIWVVFIENETISRYQDSCLSKIPITKIPAIKLLRGRGVPSRKRIAISANIAHNFNRLGIIRTRNSFNLYLIMQIMLLEQRAGHVPCWRFSSN